jgi:hypothetical protein
MAAQAAALSRDVEDDPTLDGGPVRSALSLLARNRSERRALVDIRALQNAGPRTLRHPAEPPTRLLPHRQHASSTHERKEPAVRTA